MATKMIIKNVRLTYAHLFSAQKASRDEDAPLKFSTGMLIPKDHPQVAAIKAAIKKEAEEKFGAKAKKILAGKGNPLKDMDATDEDGERVNDDPVTEGHYQMNASSKRAPQVVDRQVAPIVSDSEIWSGCYANVSVAFFPYDVDVNKGVGVGLNNVQKVKEGERLGGAPNADEEFEEIEDDEEDGFSI